LHAPTVIQIPLSGGHEFAICVRVIASISA